MRDSTVNVNHGTTSGAMTAGQSVEGRIGRALSFDGTDDFVDYGDLTALNFGVNAPFTLSGWVRTTESFGTIIAQRHSVDGGAVINIMLGFDGAATDAGRLMVFVRQSGGWWGTAARITGGIINNGVWHHFVLTRNAGNVIELFLNGVSQGTHSGTESGGAITTNLRAFGSERKWVATGFGTPDQRFLSGQIDEIHISNVIRSPAWIRASFESGQGTLLSVGVEEIR
jgi:hypothetical protein